jgi:hypothetical protein
MNAHGNMTPHVPSDVPMNEYVRQQGLMLVRLTGKSGVDRYDIALLDGTVVAEDLPTHRNGYGDKPSVWEFACRWGRGDRANATGLAVPRS